MKSILRSLNAIMFVFLLSFLFIPSATVHADDAPVPIHLHIETATQTLFDGDLSVNPCSVTPDETATTTNALCALQQSNFAIITDWQWSPSVYVSSIGGASDDAAAGNYWTWFSDLNLGQTAVNEHILTSGEHLLFVLGVYPLKISVSDTSPLDGATTTVSVSEFGFDSGFSGVWSPADGAAVSFGGEATTTDSTGSIDITATSSSPFNVAAVKTGFVGSDAVTITPQAAHSNITIRSGAAIAYSGSVELPASGAGPVLISPTTGSAISVPARSLLSVLETLDAANDSFSISDLQYYDSFGSFFLNCITIPGATTTPFCGSWQFAVNGTAPSVGMDHFNLQNGDIAFIYFGNPRQTVLSAAIVEVDQSFTATAESYDPSTDSYSPVTGLIIGVTQTNPDDPWNPLIIATSTVNNSGQAIFSLSATGTYTVGIAEDFYFPSVTLTVTEASTTPPEDVPDTDESGGSGGGNSSGGGGGGGGGVSIVHNSIDVNKALQFLSSRQQSDGSFGGSLYTDWAAIALAAGPSSQSRDKIISYLKSAPDTGVSATDDERRAMALLSLGINPYGGTGTNYIQKIINRFDGAQIGDPALVNDDIFAIFPLMKSGYAADDAIIQKVIAFVVSKQRNNGSWEGSIDMTAAAVQSLSFTQSLPGVSEALAKSRNYLVSEQQNGGGWNGGSFSTSWVLQAIAALSESSSGWIKNNYNPQDYLFSFQQGDGGIESVTSPESTRIWATSYAIPAALNKSWSSILSSFPRPTAQTSGTAAASGGENTTIASSTEIIRAEQPISDDATSTIAIATTTEPANMTDSAADIVHKTDQNSTIPVPQKKPEEIDTIKVAEIQSEEKIKSSDSQLSQAALAAGGAGAEPIKHVYEAVARSIISFVKNIFSVLRHL